MYRFQVILLRGVVLFIEIPGTLGHFVAHYVLDLPESWPMACHFYYSLILPAAAEVMVSIISLQVKKFKPKPNLRIDFIFLVILTAVLYLGEFSFPCLIISSVIISIFEAMYIWDICCAKIIMWSESERCEYTTSSG
uniref:Integral membrane protein n=1 Tax=Caenorhabditis tropicalis TaxID=1561998 RepID=A0A1I7UYM6_9PELO